MELVSLERRAVAKTLVYSNDRGLLFGRIPSLIRFTSSAPSLSSPSVLFLCRSLLVFLLLPFFSPVPSPALSLPPPPPLRVELLRDAIFHLECDYSCLFPADLLLLRYYVDIAIRIFCYDNATIMPPRLISHYCAIDKIVDVSRRLLSVC